MKRIHVTIFIFLFLIVIFLSLTGRCLYLQLFKNEHYSAVCTQIQQQFHTQKPQRGVILDCRGRVLAASNKILSVFADPSVITKPKTVSHKLEPILDIGAPQIYQLIMDSKNRRYIKIKTGIDPEQCTAVRQVSNGVGIESSWKRNYPTEQLVSTIVGFTSTDNRGLGGIELQYDKQLSGSYGKNVFLADIYRRPILLKQRRSILTDGVGIILTIDAAIQQFARSELLKQYKSFEAESAVAIVAEPKTGAILAMVSLPDFDPNNIGSVDPNNFRNRAINDQFEPGSMLKPITAAIALDCGVVNKTETIFCENGNYHGKGFGRIREYDYHKYGNLTVRKILVKSSNIGMAKLGQKLGKDQLSEGLRFFGFGKTTGIDLPGEVSGLLRPVDKWTGYSVTRIPFGQEITVTAIQMVRAFCILANGGHAVRPFVVKAIVGSDGEIVKLKRPQTPVGFVIKPEVAKWIVTDALVGVVNEKKNGGTGWRAKLEKWQVFGKTGTANIALSNKRGYSTDNYVASFIAGAPAEDPAIVVLVSIRKPNKKLGKGYTGGAVASPVVARILERTLTYLERTQLAKF